MQHELDWLSRYLDKKGIDLIVLYQLSVKEIIKYLRLSPFQRKCFNGIYCSCLSDFTYKELLLIVKRNVWSLLFTLLIIGMIILYWNDNFKNEVKKMLNKKVFSTMFLLSTLLVGCSSTNDFSDDKVKNNKEKVEVVEEQKEQN